MDADPSLRRAAPDDYDATYDGGFTDMYVDLSAKRLGLLHELIPGATRFAVLVNPSYPATEAMVADLRVAAAAIGRQIEVVAASTNRKIDAAFASLSQRGIEALLVNLLTRCS
jgi:putative ABC transport system substrate-binding protein